MLLNLKLALLRAEVRQGRMAVDIGWDPSKLSRIVNETLPASAEDKRLIAEYLGMSESKLFSIGCVRTRSRKSRNKGTVSVERPLAARQAL